MLVTALLHANMVWLQHAYSSVSLAPGLYVYVCVRIALGVQCSCYIAVDMHMALSLHQPMSQTDINA